MDFKYRNIILNYINENKEASIHDIVELCSITIPTARKYLNELANENLISFKRGKAVITSSFYYSNFSRKINENQNLKKQIGEYASSFISNNKTIFIGGGSTSFYILENILNYKNITIVTNSVPIITFVIQHPEINLIVIGGKWNDRTESFESKDTRQLEDLYPDISFVGAMGIDINRGVTQNTQMQQQTEFVMFEKSKESFILADSTKFNIAYPWTVFPIEKISNIITDNKFDNKDIEVWNNIGISIFKYK
ncbi:DeoR/GlpR family DNA-binding transcription regulator [Brachyspira intermedia]|uniref:DeoR/GlpR family DNA-binding transcription regulator n=1 Tax=Brachyspira intermedia TaxID=84377 RepID=UPI003003EB90